MPSLVNGPAGDAYVSTGDVPDCELVERVVHEAHDPDGNSVKGQLVAKFLSASLGIDLLISRPARS